MGMQMSNEQEKEPNTIVYPAGRSKECLIHDLIEWATKNREDAKLKAHLGYGVEEPIWKKMTKMCSLIHECGDDWDNLRALWDKILNLETKEIGEHQVSVPGPGHSKVGFRGLDVLWEEVEYLPSDKTPEELGQKWPHGFVGSLVMDEDGNMEIYEAEDLDAPCHIVSKFHIRRIRK